MEQKQLENLCRFIRYSILTSTTTAGSGHATSSLSATELMTVLMFGDIFRFEPDKPDFPNNDRLIFSKGHASPLYYALWAAAGQITYSELQTLRHFKSRLEGHPTLLFPYTEAATGSLGQGLSIGVGEALNAQYIDHLPYQTYVLLGDSEVMEGSIWEAAEIASFYHLNQLTAILDVNRLGQTGETIAQHDLTAYQKKFAAFGWATVLIDGHNLAKVHQGYQQAREMKNQPTVIIAKTLKGKGVSFLENQNGWHGKALGKKDLNRALAEIGSVDFSVKGKITPPEHRQPRQLVSQTIPETISYPEQTPTRKAYGQALVRLYPKYPDIVVLDAETSNSTYAEIFKKAFPKRFFEMYIAEQNMVGCALGLSRRGKIPFVSTFAAFLCRAFDQIRMSQYSAANIKFVGSHAGVSIGEDGSSQMGLEDMAMFRSLLGSTVLYPADPYCSERLVELAVQNPGIFYIRTTRGSLPNLYTSETAFSIGGSKVLKESDKDIATIIGAGITVHEALKAYNELQKQGIDVRVIDLYSVKPLDRDTLKRCAEETGVLITVEDHYQAGGLGEAVTSALKDVPVQIQQLFVEKMPRSGKTQELLDYEGISAQGIIKKLEGLNIFNRTYAPRTSQQPNLSR